MKTQFTRIAVYAKDVMLITGKSLRSAQRMLEEIKKQLGKKKKQLISIEEFCNVTGFNADEVRKIIFVFISFIAA